MGSTVKTEIGRIADPMEQCLKICSTREDSYNMVGSKMPYSVRLGITEEELMGQMDEFELCCTLGPQCPKMPSHS